MTELSPIDPYLEERNEGVVCDEAIDCWCASLGSLESDAD
jgi:hypothetical protein